MLIKFDGHIWKKLENVALHWDPKQLKRDKSANWDGKLSNWVGYLLNRMETQAGLEKICQLGGKIYNWLGKFSNEGKICQWGEKIPNFYLIGVMAKLQQLNSISGGQAADMKFTSSIKGKE